ncbi:MAG: hypothetical protein C0485_06520 [Pirellula sp.]|nr:hypothetical protein [Pirellula sp.]
MGSELAKTPAVASKQPARNPLNALRERTVIVVPPPRTSPQSMRDGATADESPLSAVADNEANFCRRPSPRTIRRS